MAEGRRYYPSKEVPSGLRGSCWRCGVTDPLRDPRGQVILGGRAGRAPHPNSQLLSVVGQMAKQIAAGHWGYVSWCAQLIDKYAQEKENAIQGKGGNNSDSVG